MDRIKQGDGQVGLLVGGLVTVAALLLVATVALLHPVLALAAGCGLLVLAAVAAPRGVPTVLTATTAVFGVLLLVLAATGPVPGA